jgi:hypothetical protein
MGIRTATALLAIFLASCTSLDTGYIDYRRAEDIPNVSNEIAKYIETECKPDASANSKPSICPPLLGARLFRKNVSRNTGIQSGEVYSIRIDYAYMDNVSEIPLRLERLGRLRNPFRAQAEIVVLARAFEFGAIAQNVVSAKTTDSGQQIQGQQQAADTTFVDLDFQSLNSARVIYYSPDVENGQGLNFSNIPILGPVEYGGRPVGIQIIVLELDRVSTEMKGLLSSLASLGQTAGALPSGGATDILTGLGKSLLESNQDDIIFEYRFVLDPLNQPNSYNSAPFEEGRYVLIRLQNRTYEHVWRNLELDHNTGQVYVKNRELNKDRIYTEETYFTLNIINHGEEAAQAVYVNRSLTQLRDAINASSDATSKPAIEALNQRVTEATRDLRGSILTRELSGIWEKVAGSARTLAYSSAPDASPDPTTCQVERSKMAARNAAQGDLAEKVGVFKRSWVSDVTDAERDVSGFGEEERLRVASSVSSFFFSVPVPPNAHKVSPTTFANLEEFVAFLSLGNNDLFEKVNDYAEALAPTTCEELIGLGLASRVK